MTETPAGSGPARDRERCVRILVVDGEASFRGVCELFAADPGFPCTLDARGDLDGAVAALASGEYDAVLLDLHLPGCAELEALERLAGTRPAAAFIVITGADDQALATRAVGAGAQDHLARHELDTRTLVRAVRHALERARLQEQLRRFNEDLERRVAERTRELEIFTHSLSHDLRSPLQIIDGYAQLLREDLDPHLGDEQLDYFERLHASVRRMARLLDGLLQFSRATRSQIHREPVDLGLAVRSFATALRREAPQRPVRFVVADGLHVRGDPHLLASVLENLVGNAWKFSRAREPAIIEVGRADRDGEPVFFVRDNGVGFDAREAATLFEPFRRLPGSAGVEGSGIGLAAARLAVERHGGRIWAEGRPGEGATFYFTLPEA